MLRKLLLVMCLIVGAKTWSQTRNPFELPRVPPTIRPIPECMHVVSEAANYSFKKTVSRAPSTMGAGRNSAALVTAVADDPSAVCGLYVVTAPNQLVEITIRYLHVSCESGGLLAFVDGWELNGEYFPPPNDHQLPLEQRVSEFCSKDGLGRRFFAGGPPSGSVEMTGRTFRSHQNAALLQYRVPVSGAFVVEVRFVPNAEPCHIMTEGLAPAYVLRNYGAHRNCTLTALYPAVVELKALSIAGQTPVDKINFSCDAGADRLDIGGSAGLDSSAMETASAACGSTPPRQLPNTELAPNGQAIFCGVTTVRLVSSGRQANEALVAIHPAGEADMSIATLLCGM